MSIIDQMPDVACPADNITIAADTCREDMGVVQGIAWMQSAGITNPITTPFADFTTGVNGMALEATWTTAKALADSADGSVRTLALELQTSVFSGGDAVLTDFPDGTSGLEVVSSYSADMAELTILRPSSTMIAGLRELSQLQNRETLQIWFITDTNKVFGGLTGFAVSSISAPSATRGSRSTPDSSVLTIKYRRIPVAADLTSIATTDLDLTTIL
jgi:hypothetical protein